MVDADDMMKLATTEFFEDIKTRTLCNIKLEERNLPGVVEMKLTQAYSDEQINELKTIFFIGYNIAMIEKA
jgi:hypothetical protein